MLLRTCVYTFLCGLVFSFLLGLHLGLELQATLFKQIRFIFAPRWWWGEVASGGKGRDGRPGFCSVFTICRLGGPGHDPGLCSSVTGGCGGDNCHFAVGGSMVVTWHTDVWDLEMLAEHQSSSLG